MMSQCIVCQHPKRHEIDAALLSGRDPRVIEAQRRLEKGTVAWHRQHCRVDSHRSAAIETLQPARIEAMPHQANLQRLCRHGCHTVAECYERANQFVPVDRASKRPEDWCGCEQRVLEGANLEALPASGLDESAHDAMLGESDTRNDALRQANMRARMARYERIACLAKEIRSAGDEEPTWLAKDRIRAQGFDAIEQARQRHPELLEVFADRLKQCLQEPDMGL
jgi:hypothetical protein